MGAPANLSELLAAKAEAFSPTEAKLAAHLVEHPERWGFDSTTRLASELGVHRSSIVRFARRLNFAGYPALQSAVRTAFLRSFGEELVLAADGDPDDALIQRLYARELRNLRRTYGALDAEVLQATAQGLAGAKRVLVFGRRFSYSMALHLSLSLHAMRGGVRLAPEPGGAYIDSLFDLDANDYALLVSLRRYSPEVQRVLAFLGERSIPHTLLTDASPAANIPSETRLIRAHVGSASVLDSYTALTSVSHVLLTLVSRLIPDAKQRLAEAEGAWAWFSRQA